MAFQLVSRLLYGLEFEINSGGAFFYGGTPALGSLILSIANSDGTDRYGNAYLQGITNYFDAGGTYLAVRLITGALATATAHGPGGPYSFSGALLDHKHFILGNQTWIVPSGDVTGATDATFINSLLAGGAVYLAPGTYYINEPILIPPGGVLAGPAGSWANTGGQGTPAAPPCVIKAVAAFAGDGMIVIQDQALGGYASQTTDVQVRSLTLDGSAASGAVAGIYLHGPVWGTTLADVCVYAAPGDGIETAGDAANYPSGQNAPYGIHASRVKIDSCGGAGIVLGNATDCIWEHVQVIGCTGNGWNFNTGGDHRLVNCSAENGGAIGFNIGMGGVQLIGCRTNSNTSHGVSINSGTAGQGPVTLTNCRLVSDGTGGTGFGLNINNPANGVHVSDLYIGPIEIGSATPATALNLQGTPPYVLLAGSLFWGDTASGVPAVPASWLRLRAVMAATGAPPAYTAVPDAN